MSVGHAAQYVLEEGNGSTSLSRRHGRALQLRDALGVVVTRTGIAACWAIVDSVLARWRQAIWRCRIGDRDRQRFSLPPPLSIANEIARRL